MNPYDEPTTDIFKKTLYMEGRSEGVEGLILIGMVILNRALSPISWWGDGIKDVCLKDVDNSQETENGQFSCWNDRENVNYKKMLESWDNRLEDKDFGQISWVVDGVINNKIIRTSIYKSINHYCTLETHPKWARNVAPVIVHKNHKFYSL